MEKCRNCNGTGAEETWDYGRDVYLVACAECAGMGWVDDTPERRAWRADEPFDEEWHRRERMERPCCPGCGEALENPDTCRCPRCGSSVCEGGV